MKFIKLITLIAYCVLSSTISIRAAENDSVTFDDTSPGHLQILVGDQPFATFTWNDPDIPRPYFSALHAPGNVQVTRNHPPNPETDVADHPTFHPGLWMAFGDLNGSDFWRNKTKIRYQPASTTTHSSDSGGGFHSTFHYLDENQQAVTICKELLRCEIRVLPAGTLLLWDSTFTSDKPFYFGDQEEMGIGVRVATWLRAESRVRDNIPAGQGEIVDAEGRINGEQVWGKASQWCDYRGERDATTYGVTLFCHPKNFRPSWFHARDYGLLVANPFGRKAFRQGDLSRVEVKPGEQFQLRYGVFVHASPSGKPLDLPAVYADYVRLSKEMKLQGAE